MSKKTCVHPECDRSTEVGDLCRRHYQQRYREKRAKGSWQALRRSSGRVILDETLIEAICDARASGLTMEKSAQACGVPMRTFSEWKRRGKTEDGTLCAVLAERLEQADALFELTHLRRIAEGENRWQSSAWLLERTKQGRYALIQRVETGAPGAFEKMTDQELDAEIIRLMPQGKEAVARLPKAGVAR